MGLCWLRKELAPHYAHAGRPSIDPEQMIRTLILGYVFATRSERPHGVRLRRTIGHRGPANAKCKMRVGQMKLSPA